jgi:ribonuclease E
MSAQPTGAAPPAEIESPRRRSTVREPAPVSGTYEATQSPPSSPSAAEPIVTEGNGGEDQGGDRPRRTGWWARRFAGG